MSKEVNIQFSDKLLADIDELAETLSLFVNQQEKLNKKICDVLNVTADELLD